MISLVAQERLLGAALGGVLMGGMILEQRRGVYSSIPDYGSQPRARYVAKGLVSGRMSQIDFAHLWNKAVDGTLGPAIKYLSSHGW